MKRFGRWTSGIFVRLRGLRRLGFAASLTSILPAALDLLALFLDARGDVVRALSGQTPVGPEDVEPNMRTDRVTFYRCAACGH